MFYWYVGGSWSSSLKLKPAPYGVGFLRYGDRKINYQLNSHKKIRVNISMWSDFRTVCGLNNTTASVELRSFMEQYITNSSKAESRTLNNPPDFDRN